ncbi:MAG: hypothetical protein HOQ45_22630, partial [Nocardioidaceae bacterium]|nr:hypothetical protein [Nocardioidaceae bacterium]
MPNPAHRATRTSLTLPSRLVLGMTGASVCLSTAVAVAVTTDHSDTTTPAAGRTAQEAAFPTAHIVTTVPATTVESVADHAPKHRAKHRAAGPAADPAPAAPKH